MNLMVIVTKDILAIIIGLEEFLLSLIYSFISSRPVNNRQYDRTEKNNKKD